jgi:hypothetical protein
MQVTSSNFTVAEYCEQMRNGAIVVNHDYQRTDKVWPPSRLRKNSAQKDAMV